MTSPPISSTLPFRFSLRKGRLDAGAARRGGSLVVRVGGDRMLADPPALLPLAPRRPRGSSRPLRRDGQPVPDAWSGSAPRGSRGRRRTGRPRARAADHRGPRRRFLVRETDLSAEATVTLWPTGRTIPTTTSARSSTRKPRRPATPASSPPTPAHARDRRHGDDRARRRRSGRTPRRARRTSGRRQVLNEATEGRVRFAVRSSAARRRRVPRVGRRDRHRRGRPHLSRPAAQRGRGRTHRLCQPAAARSERSSRTSWATCWDCSTLAGVRPHVLPRPGEAAAAFSPHERLSIRLLLQRQRGQPLSRQRARDGRGVVRGALSIVTD